MKSCIYNKIIFSIYHHFVFLLLFNRQRLCDKSKKFSLNNILSYKI